MGNTFRSNKRGVYTYQWFKMKILSCFCLMSIIHGKPTTKKGKYIVETSAGHFLIQTKAVTPRSRGYDYMHKNEKDGPVPYDEHPTKTKTIDPAFEGGEANIKNEEGGPVPYDEHPTKTKPHDSAFEGGKAMDEEEGGPVPYDEHPTKSKPHDSAFEGGKAMDKEGGPVPY